MMSCVMLSFLDFFQAMVNSIEFIHSGSGCHESCSLKHNLHDTEKPMVSAACICVHNRIVEFFGCRLLETVPLPPHGRERVSSNVTDITSPAPKMFAALLQKKTNA